jgi:hypothetical protein
MAGGDKQSLLDNMVVAVAVVVVFNAHMAGEIPFTFEHPSIVLQVTEYFQRFKLYNVEGDVD